MPSKFFRGSRRTILRQGAWFVAGTAVGAAGIAEAANLADRHLPIYGGAASATVASRERHPGAEELVVTWSVRTDRKLVALTFDDGPRPEWTDLVLRTLERHDVPATFFLVGERVLEHGHLLRGRMGPHEVANHTWSHRDLARADADQAYEDLRRAHAAITEVTGKQPVLLRPPYGHLGGATLLAASRLNYRVVLWSLQMLESLFPNDPAGHARHIAERVTPGAIVLAHDTGPPDRLVAIEGLPDLIAAVRARGYEFVTVSQLMGQGTVPGHL